MCNKEKTCSACKYANEYTYMLRSQLLVCASYPLKASVASDWLAYLLSLLAPEYLFLLMEKLYVCTSVECFHMYGSSGRERERERERVRLSKYIHCTQLNNEIRFAVF